MRIGAVNVQTVNRSHCTLANNLSVGDPSSQARCKTVDRVNITARNRYSFTAS